MNYLPHLTENEIRYICSEIPVQETISYFQRNSKAFARIMPGFRAKRLNQAQVSALLYRCRNDNFISPFIEKHISDWLTHIQGRITQMIKDGDSKESALLYTLPFCSFTNNVGLFFKLSKEEYSEEYITLLNSAVIAIKDASVQQDKIYEDLKGKESVINDLQSKLDSTKSDLERTEIKLNERNTETVELKHSLADLVKLRQTILNNQETIEALEAKIHVREETINDLRNELAEAKNSKKQLEVQIRSELEKQCAAKASEQQVALKPKCPRDIEEFKDYLRYNLENIGVSTVSDYYVLLIEHLSKILFQGIPILINRGVGINLFKCISNALVGRSNVKTLVFSKDISIDDIERFLSSAGRVACLDNFIGNFNETELISLFDNHRNQVIFLTVSYDKTLHYVSSEFLRYCQYLNLNRIVALSANVDLTEDPSTVEEVEYENRWIPQENRYATLLREMMGEFGFLQSLIVKKCTQISDEQDFCRMLAFDVLPYCIDVLQIAPYNTSERLNKYAGLAGRCLNKSLFMRWFAQ